MSRVSLDWKRANIVPIHKEAKEVPLNYRPVSLTSVVGKICEGKMVEVLGRQTHSWVVSFELEEEGLV